LNIVVARGNRVLAITNSDEFAKPGLKKAVRRLD
jgi:hypothetical protein